MRQRLGTMGPNGPPVRIKLPRGGAATAQEALPLERTKELPEFNIVVAGPAASRLPK